MPKRVWENEPEFMDNPDIEAEFDEESEEFFKVIPPPPAPPS